MAESLRLGERTVALAVVRNARARRYRLRVLGDGSARVTIPRGGSRSEALAFVERNRAWLERQVAEVLAQPRLSPAWGAGTEIFFRGERVRLEAGADGRVRLASAGVTAVTVVLPTGDWRPRVEEGLRRLAARELPVRVAELAEQHGFTVGRVSVRNQRSRWGSCSRRGTISLNWRLVQTPLPVRDYIILHELAHLREMNHSARFWRVVEGLCPDYRAAEEWLTVNRRLLC